jgi:hypothetical protein
VTKLNSCDEIKPLFLSLIRHFFQKIGWSNALPHIFVQVRARELSKHISLCVGPRFFTKNFQLKKLPAGFEIHVLVQADEITLQEGNFVT